MTEVTYRILLAVDIFGRFCILKCYEEKVTKEKVDMFTRMQRENNPLYDPNYVESLTNVLEQHDLNHEIDDDYTKFKDGHNRPLERGGKYICDMVFTYSSSFNGESTEYDSDYEFKNFNRIY